MHYCSYTNFDCQTGGGARFYEAERSSSGGCSGLIVQIPWNEGFGVLGRKLDNLQGFTPLLGVPEVILDLLTQPTFGAGVKRDG